MSVVFQNIPQKNFLLPPRLNKTFAKNTTTRIYRTAMEGSQLRSPGLDKKDPTFLLLEDFGISNLVQNVSKVQDDILDKEEVYIPKEFVGRVNLLDIRIEEKDDGTGWELDIHKTKASGNRKGAHPPPSQTPVDRAKPHHRHLQRKGLDATDHILAYHSREIIEQKLPLFQIATLADSELLKVSKASLEWRQLHHRLEKEGLYQTNYSFYGIEFLKLGFIYALVWKICTMERAGFGMYMVAALLVASIWHQGAFNAHDAGHSGITHNKKIDDAIGMFLGNCVGGISIGWWKATHNVHHIVTNHVEHDCDIQHLPFIACDIKFFNDVYSTFHQRVIEFKNSEFAKFIIPYQHLTFYVVLFFGRFNMYIQSLVYLINGLFSKQAMHKHDGIELMGVMVFFWWYSKLCSHIPDTTTLVCFIILSHGAAFILHIQIVISHFGLPCDDQPLVSLEFDNPLEDFCARNLTGTMDVDCPEWMDWFHGGLQYQTTHHLFPRLPRHRLRAVRKLAMEFAKNNGLPYLHYEFVAANGVVLSKLKQVADQCRYYVKVASGLKEHHEKLH